jgi:hypothetical protein
MAAREDTGILRRLSLPTKPPSALTKVGSGGKALGLARQGHILKSKRLVPLNEIVRDVVGVIFS